MDDDEIAVRRGRGAGAGADARSIATNAPGAANVGGGRARMMTGDDDGAPDDDAHRFKDATRVSTATEGHAAATLDREDADG